MVELSGGGWDLEALWRWRVTEAHGGGSAVAFGYLGSSSRGSGARGARWLMLLGGARGDGAVMELVGAAILVVGI